MISFKSLTGRYSCYLLLQRRKLRPREGRQLASSHTAFKGQNQDLAAGIRPSRPALSHRSSSCLSLQIGVCPQKLSPANSGLWAGWLPAGYSRGRRKQETGEPTKERPEHFPPLIFDGGPLLSRFGNTVDPCPLEVSGSSTIPICSHKESLIRSLPLSHLG